MLSTETPVSRPRPPAQLRRSTKANASPPPPYASAFVFPSHSGSHQPTVDTLLGSPVSATYRRLERLVSSPSPHIPASPDTDNVDWLNERSREELSGLLLKADGVIKQRESELDQASAVVKSLYDDNVLLQSRHSGLFSRLPSFATSPSISPANTPLSTVHSPHVYGDGLPMSRSSSAATSTHVRRISIRPDDLNALSEQNAELLDKLEKLEAEAASTDLAGRRMLNQLQKEIATLREDLEHTQLKSQENEEQVKRMKPLEVAWKRQVERETRAKESCASDSTMAEDEEEEIVVKDFAPGGPLSRSPKKRMTLSTLDRDSFHYSQDKISVQSPLDSSIPLANLAEEEEEEEDIFAAGNNIPMNLPASELALVSRLLIKIQELEETNTRILEQQTETANKVRVMQKETESMTKLYESLNDPDNELVRDDDSTVSAKQGPSSDTTIRFRSFRKTLEGGSKAPVLDDTLLNRGGHHKPRKSVLNLFDFPSSQPPKKGKGLSIPFEMPTRHPSSSVPSIDLHSPALSSLHLSSSACSSPSQELSPSPFYTGSLQSELGDNWSLSGPPHHLRNTSLYSGFENNSAPPSPTPDQSSFSFRSLFAAEMESYHREHGFSTPTKSAGLQLTVEPPTPASTIDAISPSRGSPAMSPSHGFNYERSRRMSQTVRSRTQRWVKGRFTESVLAPSIRQKASELDVEAESEVETYEDLASNEGNRTPRAKSSKSLLVVLGQPVLPRRLSDAFDNVVEKFQGHRRSSSHSESSTGIRNSKEESRPTAANAVEVFVDQKQVAAEKQKGIAKVMVEVWMWLQFGIVILVFLWAMARKGPKSVLVDAESKQRRMRK